MSATPESDGPVCPYIPKVMKAAFSETDVNIQRIGELLGWPVHESPSGGSYIASRDEKPFVQISQMPDGTFFIATFPNKKLLEPSIVVFEGVHHLSFERYTSTPPGHRKKETRSLTLSSRDNLASVNFCHNLRFGFVAHFSKIHRPDIF